MTDILTDHGATPQVHPGQPAGRTFVIETSAGPLRATVYENWVAMRFNDVAAARQLFEVREDDVFNFYGLNPYSGKWNFHPTSPRPPGKQPFNEWLLSVAGSFNRQLNMLADLQEFDLEQAVAKGIENEAAVGVRGVGAY